MKAFTFTSKYDAPIFDSHRGVPLLTSTPWQRLQQSVETAACRRHGVAVPRETNARQIVEPGTVAF
ncbi:hypothetical protein CLM62_46875 [Streptomyces sp. SA15]|nr:hypothetical protein CLM62_46875 [Streptomyces sp. SA15]